MPEFPPIDSGRQPARLLGELVKRRREFLEQGEVFATIALAWVLRSLSAQTAFARLLGTEGDLTWTADVPVPSGGRVDLLGQATVGDEARPLCVIEAKIRHNLELSQLLSYGQWQVQAFASVAGQAPVLGILVPNSRSHEASVAASNVELEVPLCVRTFTWESVFEALDSALVGVDRADFEQMLDLYQQYDADWVQPFSVEQTGADWRARWPDYKRLANDLTLDLQRSVSALIGLTITRVLPLLPEGYRYVQMRSEPNSTCLAIGVFPALDGVPFAIRYHRGTSDFAGVVTRLSRSDHAVERDSAGHLYVRLGVSAGRSKREMLADLHEQILRVVVVAHPELVGLSAGPTA